MQITFLKASCCFLTCEALLFFLQWTTSLSNPSRDTLVIWRLHMLNTGNQEQPWMLGTGEQGIPQQQLSEFVCISNWGSRFVSLTSVEERDSLKSCNPQTFTSVSSCGYSLKEKLLICISVVSILCCSASNKAFFLCLFSDLLKFKRTPLHPWGVQLVMYVHIFSCT